MPPLALETLMDRVHHAALLVAGREELRAPVLIYVLPDHQIKSFRLEVPGVHPSDVAKIVLATEEATMAALCMESWKVAIEATPEMRAEVDAGRTPHLGVPPSRHPDRYDALVLIGEVRGQPQVQRHWRIRTEPGRAERTFEEEPTPEGAAWSGRFTPLFVSPREAQDLAATYLLRAYLHDQTRDTRN